MSASSNSTNESAPGRCSVAAPAPIARRALGARLKRAAPNAGVAWASTESPAWSQRRPRSRSASPNRSARREASLHAMRTRSAPRAGGTASALGLRTLAFAEAEGDEAVARVVRREAHLDAIARDHADAEAPHAAGELRGHGLAAVERDLIAAAAE